MAYYVGQILNAGRPLLSLVSDLGDRPPTEHFDHASNVFDVSFFFPAGVIVRLSRHRAVRFLFRLVDIHIESCQGVFLPHIYPVMPLQINSLFRTDCMSRVVIMIPSFPSRRWKSQIQGIILLNKEIAFA